MKRAKKGKQKKIGLERIEILFKRAADVFKEHPEKAHRYVQLAHKIAMRYNIRLPKRLKRQRCKKCQSFLVPGENCTVRTNKKNKTVVVKCLECGNVMRFPYRKSPSKK